MRLVGKEEMTLRLAELAVRYTGSGYANLAIRSELERQPDARLNELLGTVALQAGEPDVARDRWLTAVELGSTNVAVYRELGRLESNLVFGQFNLDYRLPAERAERLRLLLGKSLEAAPAQIAGYEMLAWVEATAQKPNVASVMRVQNQFSRLNDKPRTLLALVMVRMRLGQTKEALALLDDMNKLQPNDWALFCAEITRARLENRPVDESKLPQNGARRIGNIVIMPPKLELQSSH
jgi:tetratricopeptide (TPR) repeat protein